MSGERVIYCELRGLRVGIFPPVLHRPMPFGLYRSALSGGQRFRGSLAPRSQVFPMLAPEDAAAFHRAGFLVQQTMSGRPGQLMEAVPRISRVNRPEPAGGSYPSVAFLRREMEFMVGFPIFTSLTTLLFRCFAFSTFD